MTSKNQVSPIFREALPASCPPQSVAHPKQPILWRLLSKSHVNDADFDSQFKKFSNRNFPDICSAKAVSLMTDLTTCRSIAKSPRMKNAGFTHVVEVKCCTSMGVWDQDKPYHVNWWPFSLVNVLANVGTPQAL